MFRKFVTALTLILVFVMSAGCAKSASSINGSGIISEEEIDVTDFTGVSIEGPFIVEITQSEEFGITVSTDNNLLSRIRVSREDDILKLSINAPGNFYPTSLKASISMPVLESLKLFDKASVGISDFNSDSNFFLTARGKSVCGGYIGAENINFKITDSKVVLKGKANAMFLECSQKAVAGLDDFILENADVKLSEESQATLNVSGDLNVMLTGASKIYYIGTPRFSNTSISEDSAMIQK